jgi:hypothetical protein
MKLTNILLTLLGHAILIQLHRYHISVVGFNLLQFVGFMSLHAVWHALMLKRLYIRI